MSEIKLVRIYEHEQASGYRILVDRLWPRGMSKEKAKLDIWFKEIAPSKELRQWFKHDPEKFPEFKEKYLAELIKNPKLPEFKALVKQHLKDEDVLFLYGAKNKEYNQAVILKEFIENN